MIILKHLQTENFKSLSSVDLTFPERGSVLIEGQNESGKSTLFEAVYVALYGKPLVGEDSRVRQEQVIQYGQARAIVRLTFIVGQQELTVKRIIEPGKAQHATLTIQEPDVQQQVVTGVRAVDNRILKELGNLDGESLRNSCFVEQKELERIELLAPTKREEAIHKLLGLGRLNKLAEQFKVKREKTPELTEAEQYLKLAQRQDEVRQASDQERDMAEYLDAVKVASQVKYLSELESQRGEVEKSLTESTQCVEEARESLSQCESLKKQISSCDQASQQIAKVHHVQETLATWVKLKDVEMTLASDPADDTKLVDRCKAAEKTLATVRTKMRLLLLTGIIFMALAVLSLVLEFLGYPAFVPLLIIVCGAIIMWLWFFRVRKDVYQQSSYLDQCNEDLRKLEIQRQAAIMASGDPATLDQYARIGNF